MRKIQSSALIKFTKLVPATIGLAVASFAVLSGIVYANLTDTSTNPTDTTSGGSQGGVSHLLKKETVARVQALQLGAYYQTPNGNGKVLRIRYSNIGNSAVRKKCFIAAYIQSGPGDVTVTLSTPGGRTRTYTVPISRVCADLIGASGAVRVNAQGNAPNNKFFADYPIPNVIGFDQASGLYKVNVDIRYSGGVLLGGSMENNVNFVVSASGPNVKLGPLGASSFNQFGLRSAFVGENDTRKGVKAATQFGIPCNVENMPGVGNPNVFDVRLYDPDIRVFGEILMWVTEDNVQLPLGRYDHGARKLAEWKPADRAYRSTGAASGVVSSIRVNGVSKGKTYRYYVQNSADNSSLVPQQGNVLSVDIPYDAVYADVNCNYKLTPSISLGSKSRYEYFPNVDVTGAIAKTGGGPVLENHPWEIYAVRYDRQPDINISGDANGNNPCNRIQAAGRISGCERIHDGRTRGNDSDRQTYTDGGPDGVGTNLCFFTRVQNPTESLTDNSTWRYSDMICAKAGILPRTQVWGYDARTLSTINTSKSYLQSQQYGSWGEYGLFSGGLNTNMASGNGLLRGSVTTTQNGWSTLTFANSPKYGSFGTMLHPVVSEAATAPDPKCEFNPDGTTFPYGAKCVIRISGTLPITGNLTYDNGPHTSISTIPRVIIIADNIEISRNVTRIDPWIVAAGPSGKISTCSQARNGSTTFARNPNNLTAGLCANRLTFNGGVIAESIYLHRTTEAGVSQDLPAEVFNLRADAFLSAYASVSGSGPVATTDSIVELPPRF